MDAHPLTMRVIQRHGCPLHFWIGGRQDAPCVALLHGALLDHLAFDAQLGPLLSAYRVFLWDCPGHGRSQPIGHVDALAELAQDLWAALDAAGIDSVALIGHSAGGFIAQFAQRSKPQRVWAMLMASTSSLGLPYKPSAIRGMKLAGKLARWIPWEGFVRLTAKSTALNEQTRAYTRKAAHQIGKKGFLEIWAVLETAIQKNGLPPGPNVPTLLVLGAQDKAGTLQSEMPRWATSNQHQLVTIPQAGHNVMQDNPQLFNAHMMVFLSAHRCPRH